MSETVHVELLIGRRVVDTNGKVAGRIHSIHAQCRGGECFVDEYHVGAAAFLSRLGISAASLVGWQLARPLRVPWHQLDLSDPERPCLRCTVEDLKR
jgi:hypothetical protein